MEAFTATPRKPVSFEEVFSSPSVLIVQTPAAMHEYKKVSGSSDAAMTYDTTAT